MSTLVPAGSAASAAIVGDPVETLTDAARRAAPRTAAVVVVADVVTVVTLSAHAGLLGSRAIAAVSVGALSLVWVLLLAMARGYDVTPGLGLRQQAAGVLRAGAAMGLLCWVGPEVVPVDASAAALIQLTASLTLLALLVRTVAAFWSARALAAAGGVSLVVAGDVEDVARTVAELQRVGAGRWRVVAARVPEWPVGVEISAPVSVGIDDLADVVRDTGAQALLLLPSRRLEPRLIRRLTWQLEATGTRLYVGTGLLDAAPGRTRMLTLGDLDLVHLRPAPMRCVTRLVKAVVETVLAAMLLVALAPLLAVTALAVRLDSPGPVLFRQQRVGRDGRMFTMLKFRTMTVDAESAVDDLAELNEATSVLFKIRQDPRVTAVGRLLRRYSLDELPQLLNVLAGSMSLVGPRPALPHEVASYDLDPRRRLAVRPGLTGLWQVSGRSDLSWDETVRLDLHYVDNWSMALDAAILCRTVHAVLGHRGAY